MLQTWNPILRVREGLAIDVYDVHRGRVRSRARVFGVRVPAQPGQKFAHLGRPVLRPAAVAAAAAARAERQRPRQPARAGRRRVRGQVRPGRAQRRQRGRDGSNHHSR